MRRRRWTVVAVGMDTVWFFYTRRGARNHAALVRAVLPPHSVAVARAHRDGRITIQA